MKGMVFQMSDCIFCKIVSGEFSSFTIYEDDDFKVILDRFPSGEGHSLIIPKAHVPNIFEIDPALAGKAFSLAVKIAGVLKETFNVADMNIVQNNGPLSGQTVDHFHIHLIPRRKGDGIKVGWKPLEPSEEDLAAIRERIISVLGK